MNKSCHCLSSSVTARQNKLECLFLASFFANKIQVVLKNIRKKHAMDINTLAHLIRPTMMKRKLITFLTLTQILIVVKLFFFVNDGGTNKIS